MKRSEFIEVVLMKVVIIVKQLNRIEMSQLCSLHQQQTLTHYCHSCRDVVCQQCIKMGPHADSRHQVIPISQASRLRQLFYLAYRDKQIVPLLEVVYKHLSSLAQHQNQLSNERRVIEKDIKLEFEGIISRIDNQVHRCIVKKQTQIKNYQEVLNQIQDLVYSFDGIVQFPQRFLLCYRGIHQQLKQLESRTLNIHTPAETTLSLKTVDLKAIMASWHIPPKQTENLEIQRQMAMSFAKANQLPLYVQKNNFLNRLLGRTVEHYHTALKKTKEGVLENQKRILNVFNQQNSELFQMQRAMVCAYCLAAFSMKEVNEPCAYNKSYKGELNYKDIEVPVEVKGQKMHYWVPARSSQRPIPDLKAHFLTRNIQKKQFQNSLNAIKDVTTKLRRYDILKGTQNAYLQQFKKDDPEGKGIISKLAFLFIMTNKFEIDDIQVQVLANLCQCSEGKQVDYQKMMQVLVDPQILFRKFEQEEEQLEKAKPQAPPSMRYRY